MKYLTLFLFSWVVGSFLPLLPFLLQLIVGIAAVLVIAVAVFYFIDTRVNSVMP